MIERSCAKDDHPHFKNEKVMLRPLRQPYHYIGKIEGGGPWKIGQNATSSDTPGNQTLGPHMDRDHFGQIWTSSVQKWPSKARVASATLSLYGEKVRGWSMKNRSKVNVFRYSCKKFLQSSYGQRSFWPNMTVLRSKMSDQSRGSIWGPVIIWRKGKGVVHEKSVKMQLLPILLQIKSPTLI